MNATSVKVGSIAFCNTAPLVPVAGPCQIESREHALACAGDLVAIARHAGVPFVYKSSFDKANRTSLRGQRGVGLEVGLAILKEIRARFGVPVLTDVHTEAQCAAAAAAVDILQIPAFLCRQTDLLVAAARTGAVVTVKKGQFLAPWDMRHVADKLASTGNERILLTERGTSFGYNTLVTDLRGLPVMAATGYPVVFDATHSVQQPGGQGSASGGDRRMVPVLARGAVSVGVAGLFVETHPDPDRAPSDGPNMMALRDMPRFLKTIVALDAIAKGNPIAMADSPAIGSP